MSSMNLTLVQNSETSVKAQVGDFDVIVDSGSWDSRLGFQVI